ncbi:MAG: hypothetical protein CO108_25680 [Deltaproteobacteria bacterium CG_4_9_14_3_um_filter_63_12]|nr:MAG: hypothetical protein CO108_25680 [Deltaproteobacteria bacterium CG_4_9_14_3_um_filter_63_12]
MAADALGALLRNSDDGRVAPEDHFAQRERLTSALPAVPGSKSHGWRWGAAALLAATLLVGAVGLIWRLASESAPEHAAERQAATDSLSFTVDGVSRTQLGVLLAQETKNSSLEFSDGSQVVLQAGGALRLVRVDADGAGLVLVDGGMHLEVVHAAATRWWVGAGPYTVRVIGTRFDVYWDARVGRLQVDLLEGQVLVDTPWLAEPVQLRASQRLVAQVGVAEVQLGAVESEWVVTSAAGPDVVVARAVEPDGVVTSAVVPDGAVARAVEEPVAASVSALEPKLAAAMARSGLASVGEGLGRRPAHVGALAVLQPKRTNGAASAPSADGEPVEILGSEADQAEGKDWSALVAAGEFEQVIAAAEQQGLGEVLVNRNPDDLIALSEAARYTKRASLARKALITLRARFGSSGQVADVAFFLGRLEEQEGDLVLAVDWYGKYADETPGGRFAEQALGRKIVALVRLGQGEAAKEAARAYLERFAGGTYEGIAKEQVSP